MITNNKTKQAINAVLLHLFRKEEYCKNLQGNMFYNMEVMRVGYGDKASQLQSQYEKVLFIKNRIEALNHLLYGKIWDLYYAFFAAVDRYNNDKAYLDQLREQKQTIDTDIETARRNKNTAYSNYEDAEAEYRRISNDYDQRISTARDQKFAKEVQLAEKRAHLAEKQSELADLERLIEDFSLVSLELLVSRIKFSNSSVYPNTGQTSQPGGGNTWDTPNTSAPKGVYIDYDDVIRYIKDAQGSTGNSFTLGGYTFTQLGSYYFTGIEYYNMYRNNTGTYDGGARFASSMGTETVLSNTGNLSSSDAVSDAIANAIKTAIQGMMTDISDYRNEISTAGVEADIAATEAEIAQLESDISNLDTQIDNLRNEKTAALDAQQTVIDSYWSSYTYWRDEQARLERLKEEIDSLITTYEGVVERDIDRIQSTADAYNDQLDSMDDKKVEEEGYPELPDPYNRDGHEPGPDVPVPDPRPEEEEEEDEDDQNDAGNDDDTE